MHFHCKCVNVVGNAYDELMTTGVSAYVCKACERASERDAASMATKRTASFEVARPNTGDEAAPVLPNGEFASMIQQLCLKIDSLTAEVGELRADNASLRQQTERTTELLRKLQVNSAADFASLQLHLSRNSELLRTAVSVNRVDPQGLAGTQFYSTVLKSDDKQSVPTAPRKYAATDKREGAAPPLSTRPSQFPGANRTASKHEAPPPESAEAPEDDDGFRLQRRRRARPNVGRNSKSTLTAVVRPPRQRALFVTRLAPGTTTLDLTSSLKDLLNGVEVTCTQLPSRHPSYSSFHVAIEEQHSDGINTPEAWPEGCLFRPFFGTLHGRQDVLQKDTSK